MYGLSHVGGSLRASVDLPPDDVFAQLIDRHRGELHVHCYRMLGRLDEAEDVVQETFLRAWRMRASLRDEATVRPWLYRIATNACLDVIRRNLRNERNSVGAPRGHVVGSDVAARALVPQSLDPYPDERLAGMPDERVVRRETLRIAFVAAVQHLPARQRAVLLLRDVVGVRAAECAEMLGMTVPAANSALQRARATMRQRLPADRDEWDTRDDLTFEERRVVEDYVRATEDGDLRELARLVADDATFTMPVHGVVRHGRPEVVLGWELAMAGSGAGQWKHIVTAANRQPAVAAYWRSGDEERFRAVGLDVLNVLGGRVVEIMTFPPATFAAFGLRMTLPRAPQIRRVKDSKNDR